MTSAFAPALADFEGCINIVLVAAASGASGGGPFGIGAFASRCTAKRDTYIGVISQPPPWGMAFFQMSAVAKERQNRAVTQKT